MWTDRVGFAQTDSTQTVGQLQDAIEEKLGIPVHRQRLFYRDFFLDNEDLMVTELKLMEKRPNMMRVEDQVRTTALRWRGAHAASRASPGPTPCASRCVHRWCR